MNKEKATEKRLTRKRVIKYALIYKLFFSKIHILSLVQFLRKNYGKVVIVIFMYYKTPKQLTNIKLHLQ